MKILDFTSFNEGLLGNLSNKIDSTFNNIKVSLFGTKSRSDLKKWDIYSKKISDKYYKFYHDDRIIAELKVDGEKMNKPCFKLTIYYYDSEISNSRNLTMNQKFDQHEEPYAKGSRLFFDTKSAIDYLIAFWSKKTNSGTHKNKDHKIKF